MYLEMLVVENIRRIRKEMGLSQEKFAELCQMPTSYIGLLETYKNVPKLSTIEKIAMALDVNPLIFFRDTNKNMFEQQAEIQRKKKRILSILDKELDYALLKPDN
jgi:transcriptional regulator with XRE-family HTH domain